MTAVKLLDQCYAGPRRNVKLPRNVLLEKIGCWVKFYAEIFKSLPWFTAQQALSITFAFKREHWPSRKFHVATSSGAIIRNILTQVMRSGL